MKNKMKNLICTLSTLALLCISQVVGAESKIDRQYIRDRINTAIYSGYDDTLELLTDLKSRDSQIAFQKGLSEDHFGRGYLVTERTVCASIGSIEGKISSVATFIIGSYFEKTVQLEAQEKQKLRDILEASSELISLCGVSYHLVPYDGMALKSPRSDFNPKTAKVAPFDFQAVRKAAEKLANLARCSPEPGATIIAN